MTEFVGLVIMVFSVFMTGLLLYVSVRILAFVLFELHVALVSWLDKRTLLWP